MRDSLEVGHRVHASTVGVRVPLPRYFNWGGEMRMRIREFVPTVQGLSTADEDEVPDLLYVKKFLRFVLDDVSCWFSFLNG